MRPPYPEGRTARRLVGLLVASAAAVLAITRIDDFDAWTHLALGRDLVQRGGFPAHEPLSFPASSFVYYNTEWLFDVVLYCAYRAGRVPGVVAMTAALATLAFFVLWIHSRPPEDADEAPAWGVWIRLAVLGWTLLVVRHRFVQRPDMALMVFLAFTIWALDVYVARGGRWLYTLPALQVLWVNVQPSLVVGVAPFVAVLGGGVGLRVVSGIRGLSPPGAPSWRQLRTIAIVLVAFLAAAMINPYGLSALTLPFRLRQNPWFRHEVFELQAPTPSGAAAPFVLLALLVVLLAATAWRWPLIELLLVVPFAMLALSAVRFVFLLAVVAAPIIARSLCRVVRHWEGPRVRRLAFAAGVLGTAASVAAASLALAQVPPFGDGRRIFGVGIDERAVPERALRYLDARSVEGRVFNVFHWGGYIEWRDFPRRAAIVDGRGQLPRGLLDEIHFARIYTQHLERLADAYDLDVAIVDYPSYSGDRPEDLVGPGADVALSSPRWALVYWDDVALVYLRRTPRRAAIIARDEFRYAKPANGAGFAARQATDPAIADGLRRELERNIVETGSSTAALLLGAASPTPQAAIAWLERVREPPRLFEADQALAAAYGRLGDRQQALRYYERALARQPSAAILYQAGVVATQLGDDRQAVAYLERAHRADPGLAAVYPALIETYRRRGEPDRATALGPDFLRAATATRVDDFVRRARTLLAEGHPTGAETALAEALRLNARDAGALTTLGYVYLSEDRKADALRTLQAAVDADPKFAKAHYALAQASARAGDPAACARHLREFVRLAPRSYEAWIARERVPARRLSGPAGPGGWPAAQAPARASSPASSISR